MPPPPTTWSQFPATKTAWTHVTEMIDAVTTATTPQMPPTPIKMAATSSALDSAA